MTKNPKPSDLPLVDQCITVYQSMQAKLEGMRKEASEISELLAIAAVADEINSKLGDLLLRRKRLSVAVRAGVA